MSAWTRPLLLLGWLGGVAVANADAATIGGKLTVPAAAFGTESSANAYPGRAHSMRQAASTRGGVIDAVISIERIPSEVESSLARARTRAPHLAQQGQAFVPRVLAVAAGTTVEFPNLDPIFHNVFSVSPVKRFDLGKYPRGQSRRVTFGKAGLVQVYCDIHASMAAYIMVLPNHAFARPDPTGAFALPDLPRGEYALKVWHPDLPELRRKVVVSDKDVKLDLSY